MTRREKGSGSEVPLIAQPGQAASKAPLDQLKSLLSEERLGRPLELTEDHILSILAVRRALAASVGKGLFSDPALDIFLELLAAKLSSRIMSVRDLAIAIEVPESTTVRWVVALDQRGLIKTDDEYGSAANRRVQLTDEAASTFKRLVDQWGSAFVSI